MRLLVLLGVEERFFMCGRFTLRASVRDFVEAFGYLPIEEPSRPLFNVSPSQFVAAVRHNLESQACELASLRWGLVPNWAEDPAIGNQLINARAETVATKPAFRQSFRQRRCLVLADGFYEWRRGGGRKQPYYISLSDGRPFAFAGVWDRWQRGGETIESCAIITTDSNELVRTIHNRMPVILSREEYQAWLNPNLEDADQLRSLLKAFPAAEMTAYPVGTLVNDPRNDAAECIERAEEPEITQRQLWLE